MTTFNRFSAILRLSLASILTVCALCTGIPDSAVRSESIAPANASSQSLLNLRGREALEHLKQKGLYARFDEALAAAKYDADVPLSGGAYQFSNLGQGFRATFTRSGTRVVSSSDRQDRELVINLIGYGYGSRVTRLDSQTIVARRNRIEREYSRSTIKESAITSNNWPQFAIKEWFVNSEAGIEHGFTLPERPPADRRGAESLRVEMSISGDYNARLDAAGRAVTFACYREGGALTLTYDKLRVYDARNREMAARFELDGRRLAIIVDEGEAEYPLTIDPLIAQQPKLTASGGAANDLFGEAVAISGDTVVVGAPLVEIDGKTDQGAVYIFTLSGTTWNQQAKLTASDGAASDLFGEAVAISGDTVAVGARSADITGKSNQGAVYVFAFDGTTWKEQQKLTASGGGADDFFGDAVAIDADTVVAGAPSKGAIYVFARNGTTWNQQGPKLTASDGAEGDRFGQSVAIDADTVLAGAPQSDIGANSPQGAAYIFTRSGASWTQGQKLTASDATARDEFGFSVALSGETLAVGAPLGHGAVRNQGASYIFARDGANWSQQAKLTAFDGEAGDRFGFSVAIDADSAVVGARFKTIAMKSGQGAVYVFARNGVSWSGRQKLMASDGAAGDEFGVSVTIDAGRVIAGARAANVGLGAAVDQFGQSVAAAGANLVDAGMNMDQGAVYIFACAECPTITLSPGILPVATVGNSQDQTLTANHSQSLQERTARQVDNYYEQTITATGGVKPYNFSVSAGTLAPGLSLSPTTGTISGVPIAAGSFSFVITATDANGSTGSQDFTLFVSCQVINITLLSLPSGIVGAIYNQTLATNAGTPPISFAVTTGALPPGLTLSTAGALSGAPTANGTFNLTITATDTNGCTGSRAYTLTIACPPINITPSSLTSGVVGSFYNQTLATTAGAQPISFAVTSGDLPPGLTLSTNGALSGVPTEDGTFNLTVTATDANGCTGSQPYTLAISCPAINLTPSSLTSGVVGSFYNQPLATTAGTQPISFAVTNGSLPPGLTLSTNGVISGVPTEDGTFNLTITATDAFGCTGSQPYTLAISCPAINLTPSSLTSGVVGSFYSQTLATTAGTPPISFAVTSGSLPPGLTLSTNGVISGVPTTAGTFNLTITATDAFGCTGSQAYTLVISCPAINITPSSVPNGTVGVPYPTQTLATTAGTPPINFAVTSGELPPGLTLASNGILSGTPIGGGSFSFTVTATDAFGCTGSQNYTIVVAGCPLITVNPINPFLPSGMVGQPYSQTFTASGGTAPHSFTVVSGALPTGLTLAPNGVLSGTPTAAGIFNFTVQATDANACSGSRAYRLAIGCPVITLSPSALPNATVGAPYSQTITAIGGVAPFQFSISSGSLPPGLTLSAGGTISGAPTALGVFSFTITATDANGCIGAQPYTITVSCPVINITPSSLPSGTVGALYTQTLATTAGTPPVSFAVTSGALPPGLTLSTNGVISGAPTTAGTFTFTVTATDAFGCTGSQPYTITVSCPTINITPSSLPNGTVGAPYPTQTLATTGGTPPISFAVTSGELPLGLTLSTNGVISGAPTEDGTFNFIVRATDAFGCIGSQLYTITVSCPTIAITPSSLPNGVVGAPYPTQTLTTTGGTPPINFAVTSGDLPPGLTLSTNGVISGAPTAAGTFNFTVTATDANGCTGSQAYTITTSCPAINIIPSSLPNGAVGVIYTQTLTTTAGTPPISFDVTSGSLPPGLTLSDTGVISGSPTAAGTFNFTITATDAFGCTGSQPYTISISCPAIDITPSSLPNGTVGVIYNQTLATTAGTPPINFAVTGGELPPGLALASNGILSGTPTGGGSFSFTVTATDANGCAGVRDYTIVVAGCPLITVIPINPILPSGIVGQPYSQTFIALGGTAPHSFTVVSGALPTGLTLASNGVLSGTPTAAGIFNFTVQATDANACTGSRDYTLTVIDSCPTITLSPSALPNATVGAPYSQTVTAIGGVAPFQFSVSSGSFPPGLTLSVGGTISGAPTTPGAFSFTITATDANGCTGALPYTITVSCPVINITPSSLPSGTVGALYTQTLTTTAGTPPVSFAVTSGALPPGLTLSTNGVISGAPTTVGTFNFTITATDAFGCAGSQTYTIVVSCPAINITPSSLPNGTVGVIYTQTLSTTAGTPPIRFDVTSGSLPPGLTLSTNGVISGAPTTVGTFNFTITATDAFGCAGSQTYTISISCPAINITPSSLPNGTVGVPYPTQTLATTAGSPPINFAVTSGELPPGLTLASNGILSGTPIGGGSFSFTVTATDAFGCVGSQNYTIVVAGCPLIIVIPINPFLPSGLAGQPYSQTFTALGGTAPHSFTVVSGALPTGLTLASNGVLSGTPTAEGIFNFTVQATDANACSGSRAYRLAIGCPVITLSPSALPNATVGAPYSQTVTAIGGVPPFQFSISSGSLPPGLTLSAGGTISGAPTTPGAFSFTITATDADGCIGALPYTITVSCPMIDITPSSLPNGTVGSLYTQTLTTTTGTPPINFAVTSGALPPGLTLSINGVISGAPTTVGTFNFTDTATDANGCAGSQPYTITVSCPAINIIPSSLPDGTVGVIYTQTLTTTGGTPPISFAVTSGALPPGLALSDTGVISGSPTADGTFTFTVTATDANGCAGSQPYTITVSCPAINIMPSSLPSGTVGVPYPTQTLTTTGGTPPINFAVTSGDLPPGLTLTLNGILSGTPTGGGAFSFTVTAIDANRCVGVRDYTIIVAGCPLIIVIPINPILPSGMVGQPYSQTITALGGTAPRSFTVVSGALPTGLTLASNGVISGTPTAPGTFNFTVQATDANACTGSRDYTLVIGCPVITLSPSALPNATVGAPYSQTVTAIGGVAPFQFSISSGSLPPGLTLSAGGTISGAPTTPGIFSFIITATDANGCTGAQPYTITVSCPVIDITPSSLPNGTVGALYTQTLATTAGTPPVSFAVASGALPPGLTLSTNGVISGAPTAAGTFNFTVTATDANGCAGSRAYTIVVSCPAINITPSSVPNGVVGVSYPTQTLTTTGGTPPVSFALTSGSLPSGLTLSAAGVISGAPTSVGTFNFSVTATDNNFCQGVQAYTIVVTAPPAPTPIADNGTDTLSAVALAGVLGGIGVAVGREVLKPGCPPITVNPISPTLVPGRMGQSYNQTFTAAGGSPPYNFTITSGAPPPGLFLDPGGLLSGLPTAAGAFTFSVTATDNKNCSGERDYTVVINPPFTTIIINPETLPDGATGLAYSLAMSAEGGASPLGFSVLSGSLPAGLTLAVTGLISGTPTVAGTSNFTALVTDRNGHTSARDYAITINKPPCPALTVTPASLPNGEAGKTYIQTLKASGGTGPFMFSLSEGAPPSGLVLDPATGSISGTPSQTTTSDFTIRLTDSDGCIVDTAYRLRIAPRKFMTVSARNHGPRVTPKEMAVGLGSGLADRTVYASSGPAPISLDGMRVIVKDSAGVERAAPLLLISPTRIKYRIPDGVAQGAADVSVFDGHELVAAGTAQIAGKRPSSSSKTSAAARRRRRSP